MNALSKVLDSTRYTMNGINGLIAGNSRMGEIMQQITGMTMEQMASAHNQLSDGNDNSSGADQANGMMEMMVGPIADGFATSSILYEMIDEYASSTDMVRRVLKHPGCGKITSQVGHGRVLRVKWLL